MKKYGFGIDLGGTTIKIGLFETTGTLLDKWEIPTNKNDRGSHILNDIASALDAKMQQRAIAKEEIQGIGIGVPGPVLSDGTVNRCVNLGWDVFNVAEALSSLTGFPVRAGNDANVAALGEMWQGGGKGHTNIVMVTLGTGVGGGIIIDGKMVSGATGGGGEIGHIPVCEDETERCTCGKYGCLEQYASATGIVRLAKRRLAADSTPSILRDLPERTPSTLRDLPERTPSAPQDMPELTAKDIFDAAKAGDALAIEVAEQFGDILGKALAIIACVVNPEVIVIGGGVSKAGEYLLPLMQESFRKNVFHACAGASFVLATLGNDAGIYGCMQMVIV